MAKKKKPKFNPGDIVYWLEIESKQPSDLQKVMSKEDYIKIWAKRGGYTKGEYDEASHWINQEGIVLIHNLENIKDAGWIYESDIFHASKAMIILFGKINGKKKKPKV